MKAITVRQPWAHAIIHLGKDIENRSWPTRLRGRVAIHAAGAVNAAEHRFAERFIHGINPCLSVKHRCSEVLGAIIGTVEIVDCVTSSESPWFMGSHGFVLRNPIAVHPIACKGMLGFWQVPDDIASILEAS